MKILQLHNRYQIRGGEDGVQQAEALLLQQYGHQVDVLEVSNDDIVSPIDKGLTAVRAIYSFPAKRQVATRIAQVQPDVVHVHNFFPLLSPSIYDACADQGVPVVQTLHNYRLVCVKAMLFRENQVCEACLDRRHPWLGVKHACYRDSPTQSAVLATMLATHRWRRTWENKVDAFITLTDFQRQKLIQAGLPAAKLHTKPNFLATAADLPASATTSVAATEPFVLFVGRLSEEKGIAVAIQAYQHNPQLPGLKIVGDGPDRVMLEQQVAAAGLSQKIQFLGYQQKPQVLMLMQQALALVFPSIWYEGFPLTIVEAFGCGLPPIVSRLGSMAEIVQHQQNGLHFTTNDPVDLAQQIHRIAQQPEFQQALAAAAHETYQQLYTPAQNYAQLMAIYDRVLQVA
ncbi:glycosyltransferase family 4 protein [filamentous cyanobacterium LEGE 11480]|uniref:Glycosyltransferase family 4 protein n=1 Tax=Romeriopsis navalis LEGE 11480 TaxID=2777977 RepID=A0A928Z3N3_9CYAN|nr:glycosyltransferase family 4 protein [Romeriopsis navalis]MBE9030197.1 glycosyltransferase family 4 protein [Romeriopsis navalis LEGE 11480]